MISDRCFLFFFVFSHSLSRDSVLATDCLGNITEVVSHSGKNNNCASGEMKRTGENLVNEVTAICTNANVEREIFLP